MFEELIAQLDELGIEYNEDYDAGVLTIDVASMEKTTLIDVISILTNGGYVFDINESTITVEAGMAEEPVAEENMEEAALNDALAQM